jgi:membrane protein
VRSRLTWLGGLIVYLVVLSPLKTGLNGLGAEHAMRFVSAVGASALFLWTPSVLLGRRVPWRRLLPTAAVTGGATLVLGIGSAIVMPGVVSHNTERYGLIGFTFSMVSWLFVAALVVIAAAIVGKLLDEELVRAAVPPESGDAAGAGSP